VVGILPHQRNETQFFENLPSDLSQTALQASSTKVMASQQFLSVILFQLVLFFQLVQPAPRPQDSETSIQSDKKDDPVVIVLRPSDLIPKIELPNLELPNVGAVFPDGFPMLPPGFGKVEIPRVDLSIFGRAATEEEEDCGIVCQMLRTVDQQLGVVHRQIADINQRIAKWEEGGLEVEVEEDNLEEEDMEEEDNLEDGGVKTLLDLGDGSLLTEDWTNSTVTEEVLEDGSVLKVNRTTVFDKEEDGKGFSFVHSVRKTKKGASEEAIKDDDMEEDENLEDDEENVEGEGENEIFSKRK